MISGKYEEYLVDFIITNMPNYDTFINIGANIGFFPCIALQSGAKRVLAIEPDPINFSIMQKNIEKNRWTNKIRLQNIACGSKNEILKLFGRDTGASFIPEWEGNIKEKGQSANVSTLDTIFLREKDFGKVLILIDAEGFEYEIIKGSTNFLNSSSKITWIIETSLYRNADGKFEKTPWLKEFFEIFKSAGYRFKTWEDSLREMNDENLEQFISGKIIWPALPFLISKND
jgi:FkbM family methyltransferase